MSSLFSKLKSVPAKRILKVLSAVALTTFCTSSSFADTTAAAAPSSSNGLVAIAAAIVLGLAAAGGTMSQGKALTAALDSIGRNPGSADKLFVPLLLGLAFIESLVVISFVIAFILVGKV